MPDHLIGKTILIGKTTELVSAGTTELGSLEGNHDVLSVTADGLKRGDALLSGECFRVLIAPVRRYTGYMEWEVAQSLTGPVLGTWQFRDDGVARVVVLRKRPKA